MTKIAKLVCVSLMTRVIVDENATEYEIINQAKSNLLAHLDDAIHENIESVEDDEECPYDPKFDGE